MMKAVLLVFGILFYISLAEASLQYEPPNPLRKPGGCYDGFAGIGHMTGNETRYLSPDQCAKVFCDENGGGTAFIWCGAIGTKDPNCGVVPGDKNKIYPGCCPEIKCDP